MSFALICKDSMSGFVNPLLNTGDSQRRNHESYNGHIPAVLRTGCVPTRQRHYRTGVMVATLAQAASAAYYLESQRSFRHPNEYYTAGEEPDGVWFNPHGLFGLEDGGKVDSSYFHRLYHGFAPNGGDKLTQNAGSERRSAGLDMTFSADKSVSALWAVADPELRSKIERRA